jgi:hypothetical protein
MKDGGACARQVRGKLRSIRRRFVVGLGSLVEPSFFSVGDAQSAHSRFDQNSLTKRLAAAYDLRSRYVHTGRGFGRWVGPRGDGNEEVHHGKPGGEDKEFARMLAAAPTYIGLERLVRYCLLRKLEQLGVALRPKVAAVPEIS